MYSRSPVTHFLHTDYNILSNYKKNVGCVSRFGSETEP